MPASLLYQQVNNQKNVSININAYESIKTITKKMNKNDVLVVLGSHYFGCALNKIFKNCFDNQYKA